MIVEQAGDVAKVVARCQQVLGPVGSWITPRGYPDGLALCTLDSVWSIGVRYAGVLAVLGRYRDLRQAADADPEQDSLKDLR